jgi:alkanesulfonate monooxygenase SsuD/methylene tetrahydromethanopterin reductase-like flavin-dependent oxidoreductase (luciferase family)
LIQRPSPPIIVGGSVRSATGRLAVRYADELNIQFKQPMEVRREAVELHEACERVHRDPDTLRLSVLVGITTPSTSSRARENQGRVARLGAALANSEAELADKLNDYREAGASSIYISLLHSQGIEELGAFAQAIRGGLSRHDGTSSPSERISE